LLAARKVLEVLMKLFYDPVYFLMVMMSLQGSIRGATPYVNKISNGEVYQRKFVALARINYSS
jgi:hypothetical protein